MEYTAHKLNEMFNNLNKKINESKELRKKLNYKPTYKKEEKEGFIYFIQNKSGNIKIGWSNSPHERLKILQTGSSDILYLIGCIRGTIKDEKKYHKIFKSLRINNEWFYSDDNLLQFIKERDCRKEYGI